MCKEKKKRKEETVWQRGGQAEPEWPQEAYLPMVLAGAPEMGCLHEKQIRQWENNLILM